MRSNVSLQTSRLALAAFVLACFGLMGCGSSSQLPLVPVKGKITFAGEKPPAKVSLTFAALETENELPRIPGIAVVADDGSYYVQTEQVGNGLIPGRYVVNVECWKQEPTMDNTAGESYIPRTFKPEELEVKAGSSTVQHNIDVTAAK